MYRRGRRKGRVGEGNEEGRDGWKGMKRERERDEEGTGGMKKGGIAGDGVLLFCSFKL